MRRSRYCKRVDPQGVRGIADRRLKIFFDGGCRPNPGQIEAAAVLGGVVHRFSDLGHGSSQDAEWLALIGALELAQSLAPRQFVLLGDALQVVRAANRVLLTRQAAPGHEAVFLDAAVHGPPSRIRWIKRTQNLAGIALAARHPR